MIRPLSRRHVRILLVLAEEPLHGYRVSQKIEERTDGEVVLKPGSLYRALHQLLERGLIAETEDDDERRRTYRVTPTGRDALARELARMERLVSEGRRLGTLGAGGGQ